MPGHGDTSIFQLKRLRTSIVKARSAKYFKAGIASEKRTTDSASKVGGSQMASNERYKEDWRPKFMVKKQNTSELHQLMSGEIPHISSNRREDRGPRCKLEREKPHLDSATLTKDNYDEHAYRLGLTCTMFEYELVNDRFYDTDVIRAFDDELLCETIYARLHLCELLDKKMVSWKIDWSAYTAPHDYDFNVPPEHRPARARCVRIDCELDVLDTWGSVPDHLVGYRKTPLINRYKKQCITPGARIFETNDYWEVVKARPIAYFTTHFQAGGQGLDICVALTKTTATNHTACSTTFSNSIYER